jgi:rubrerythrin
METLEELIDFELQVQETCPECGFLEEDGRCPSCGRRL